MIGDERRPARLNALGRHLLLELFDCDLEAINNLETVKGALTHREQGGGRRHLINPQSYKWFFETTTPVEGHMHAIVRTLASLQTKFQLAEIMETASYGKVLVLDGRIQSSQADEFIYHDALVHPGMLTTESAPRTALIIGGGEGATLREVLRYPSITRAVMVDIDGEVVDLCRRHLPEMHQGAFEDRRAGGRHEDARGFLARAAGRLDLITIALGEPPGEGPARTLVPPG